MAKQVLKLFIIFILLPFTANAEEFVAGTNYDVLVEPVRVLNPEKIEVVEVFWYGCGHCFRFEPSIEKWKAGLTSDVKFVRNPAMWNENMETHAKIFYAAEVLGVGEKMHLPIFNAMNKDQKKLIDEAEIAELFAKNNISADDFKKAFNSFGVASSVKQADARARSYKITGTPEMVVNGKYRVSAKSAGGQDEMLKVVDFLIAKERAAKSKS